MSGSCAKWLELLAAYKAGQRSNKAVIDADTERAKVDDSVSRKSDDAVAAELQRWER